jgi:dTDP-4-dehydrorhamnose 3,5-epimerase
MNWELSKTNIEGCILVSNPEFSDLRGTFSETYKKSLFKTLGLPEMQQDNHLVTKRGGIRAMHWQDGEYSQAKLINVVVGEIFDAVYDLRIDSSTFGTLATFELNDNSPMLFVPAGCAHGFQGVSDVSIVHYKTDKEYEAQSQRAFAWNDPSVQINWPVNNALISEKDAQAPMLSEYLQNE